MQVTSLRREIVLWGIGHTNAHVLLAWKSRPIPSARLTCVSDTPVATYSGMLPAVLAGQMPRARMEIDLERLCSAAGARLLVAEGIGLSTCRRRLLVVGHSSVPFDLLSIGIGSVPSAGEAISFDRTVLPIKPMWSLLDRLRGTLLGLPRGRQCRAAVVGGGAGGVEIALCLPHFIRAHRPDLEPAITLVDANERLLPGSSRRTSQLARTALDRAGVTVELGRRVVSAGSGAIALDDASRVEADVILWATGASGSPSLARLGLATDDRGFLLTRPTLQTLEDDAIFAVGDSGTMRFAPTAKAGVFAVRQGPVLWENVRRTIRGTSLLPYLPQRQFLRILNTGGGCAIAEYRGLAFHGRAPWLLKKRIDEAFVRQYQ